MTREINLGSAAGFADPGRRLLDIDGVEIAVFHHRGSFTAFLNLCPHLGGPACSGKILPLAIEAIGEGRYGLGRMHSKDDINVVCPWHGYEFSIRTGEHPTNKRIKLRALPVRVENGEVHVALPAPHDKQPQEAG